jgi:predicted TIM-barrel fold metal-dependent hydrolase
MAALMGAYPRVYIDLGAIDWAEDRGGFNAYLKRLIDAGFGKRILFGSDQMVWPEAIGQSIDAYRQAAFLTPEQKRDILFDNAVRFFGWKDLAACGKPSRP